MSPRCLLAAASLLGIATALPVAAAPLFDGQTFAGWEGDTAGVWRIDDGALYDESRRNKILAKPADDVLKQVSRPGEWHDYRIRAEGPRVQLWVNGIQTVDYTETEPVLPATGVIALQIHGNAVSEVRFKDIEIDELP